MATQGARMAGSRCGVVILIPGWALWIPQGPHPDPWPLALVPVPWPPACISFSFFYFPLDACTSFSFFAACVALRMHDPLHYQVGLLPSALLPSALLPSLT